MTEPVRYELTDGVATITLNRPDAMNGLDIATKEALLRAVRAAEQDAAVRCVVLTGSGRAFCVGQDLVGAPVRLSLPHQGGGVVMHLRRMRNNDRSWARPAHE